MSQSSLATDHVDFGTKNSNPRKNNTYNPTGRVSKITIHHMAGISTGKACAEAHFRRDNASANYYIGNAGDICSGVTEDRRAQTSGSGENDYVAITIEVSNSTGAPEQKVSDAAYKSLIKLCIDICKRNGIASIRYTGDKSGNLTMHKQFQATACPGPYLEPRFPNIAAEINKGLNVTPASLEEEKIWNYLMSKFNNAYGVAGLMGNLYAESGLKSNNLQDSYERILGMSDDQYTQGVDNGTYPNFVQDKAGYGLAQWTFQSRKQNLYSHCKQQSTSISDLDMQLDFLCNVELPGYKTVYATLQTATSVREASDVVLTQFERPRDQSEEMKQKRAAYGQVYYDKYAGSAPVPPQPTPPQPSTLPYVVKVVVDALNYRSGPGTQYPVKGTIYDQGYYTIVKESANQGFLKSGAGWICLDYVKKV